ncbi:hypothetical protein J2X31_001180 [Flavobacterium arsenatis]|uniref:LVIVD repeat-containing protein n=1 Tax=Flavobacterium arsenatis TaxID=1484332 RepID=A0ABU1TMR6_9FLAO|nr:hypothetical protein [Flavobacterium arsenatis]MDR6967173.1 hypothetical protein [Flavobacterium arsenatis]
MKKLLFTLFSLLIFTVVLNSCWTPRQDDDFVPIPNNYTPVIISRTELENSVEALPPQNVIQSGKIYIKDNFMFINEVNKGFHVYNYSNPQDPVKIGFIKIPGATDLAIRNNIIYINQAVDLVTLTYNQTNNSISVSNRNRNVFPTKVSPQGFEANVNENMIVIGWTPLN